MMRFRLLIAVMLALASPVQAQDTVKVGNTCFVVPASGGTVTASRCAVPRDTVIVTVRDTVVLPPDTVIVVRRDTLVVTNTVVVRDTVVVTRADTVVVTRVDTTIVTRVDTLYLPPADTTPPPVDTVTPPPPPPVDTVAPPVPVGAHPRVWMTPARIEHLKAQMAANTTRWQRVKLYADQQVAKGAAHTNSDRKYLPTLCAAYLATGVQGYADRAAVLLTAYAGDATNMRRDSGYDFRFIFPVITMGLDWCYHGLPVAVRRQVADWLMDWADWVWLETNPTLDSDQNKRYAITRPTNNYWWGFTMTGPAALAASDDDPRGAFHAALGHKRWGEAQAALFTTAGVGGSHPEGTGYDVAWYVGRFADAYLTAGQPVTDPWLEASLHWRLHTTMPGGRFLVPFGDQARVSDGVLYAYDRMRALTMLNASGASPQLRGQIQTWLNWIGEVPYAEAGTGALTDELLHFNPAQPSVPLSGLPLSYLSADKLIYRTSWTDTLATVFVFDGSPILEGHQSNAGNSLLIWKGSNWITGGASIYSHSGIRHETRYNNTLTVPGVNGEQLWTGNPASPVGIVASSVTSNLIVVRGQAAGSYGRNGVHPVTDYLRTVAYLPDRDVFVVVDRVTVQSDATPITIRWHNKVVPPITGNRFTLTNPNGDQRCAGEAWSQNLLTVGSEPQTIGLSGAISSHAVTLTVNGGASDILVTVLQCGSVGSAAVARDANGVTVTVNGVAVRVPNSEQAAVTR